MAELYNRTQNKLISQRLRVADTLIQRAVGLLGKHNLVEDEMLWIKPCNSIHTFFMQFPIDCVFLDKKMAVCAIRNRILPWRLILPILKARSVIEMNAGHAQILNIQLGDVLHVGH